MKRNVAIGSFLAAVAIGSVLVACESIIGAHFSDVQEVNCAHVTYPPPPQIGPSPTDQEVVFVIDSFDLGEQNDANDAGVYRTIGYDLDNLCTNESQPPDCVGAQWANPDPTDGIDGRDNGIGQLVHAQSSAFGSDVYVSSTFSAEIPQGKVAPVGLFRVTGYSGEANDDAVTVEWYTPALPLPTFPPVDWTASPVKIPVSLASLTGTANADGGITYAPSFKDTSAYVSGSTLVAHFNVGFIEIVSVPFPIASATLTGTLSGKTDHLTNGSLVGIVRATDMFATLPRFTQTLTGAPVCKSDAYYKTVKSFYCKFVDIQTGGGGDPTVPCDGDSFGVSFTTRAATVGPPEDDSQPALCVDSGVDDDCTNPP